MIDQNGVAVVALEHRRLIDPARLDGAQYVPSLLREAEAAGLISTEDVERFQLAVLGLLAHRCRMYQTGASVREEVAQGLLEGVLYTIGVACKKEEWPEEAAQRLVTCGPEELFEEGRLAARSVFLRAKQLWMLVLGSKTVTGNHSYNDTFCERGLGRFFQRYDVEFSAHEIPGDIDYQLCVPVENMAGAEFIRQYLGNALCENRFCARFEHSAVKRLLTRYNKRCDKLLLNVFGVVLTAATGCVLAGVEPRSLTLHASDLPTVCAALGQDVPTAFGQAVRSVAEQMGLRGAEADYVVAAVPQLTPDIMRALKIGAPERAFPVNAE